VATAAVEAAMVVSRAQQRVFEMMGNKFSDNLQVLRPVMGLKVVTAVALPARVAMLVKPASGTLSKGTRKEVTSKGVTSKQASSKEVTQQPTAAAVAINVPPASTIANLTRLLTYASLF